MGRKRCKRTERIRMDIPENQQQTGGPILDSKRLADLSHPYKRVEHIGDAILYLGDAFEIMPILGQVDHVIADPPYEEDAHTPMRRTNKSIKKYY